MRRAAVVGTLAFLPAAALLALGAGALVAGDDREVVVATAVPVALLTTGLVFGVGAAAVLVLLAAHRRALTRTRTLVREQTMQEDAASHRLFLDRLDHELKNPATAIRAAVAASADRTPELDVIDAQTVRLSRLVADLRKLAYLQTIVIDAERIDIDVLVADVVDAIHDTRTAGEILVALPTAPWPLPAVSGDPDLLFVAVYNVVANAVKYADDDAILEIRGHEHQGTVVLEIADTGRGIPADELAGVMDELARASNARDLPGSGLGLALTRVIMQRHGGGITMTSVEGRGTNVRLSLPATH